jgi:2-oxoglutarate dehydrogenase E2 component (dihydrolipoamide succinyltransferase)
MKVEMIMPQMGESITEATVLKWLKKVGDKIEQDETILEISTDKVDSEIPAPAAGVIAELKAKEGDVVPVKSVIAVIETDASATIEAPKATPPAKEAAAKGETTIKAEQESPNAAPEKQPEKATSAEAVEISGDTKSTIPAQVGDKFYSPLVRTLAAQYNISAVELNNIPGTGSQGRVSKGDLLNYIQHRSVSGQSATPSASSRKSAEMPAPTARPQYDEKGLRVEPFDKIRKIISEHMVRSKATSPHVYTIQECDVTNIAKWRSKMQSKFVDRYGFKLSYTPFFLEAVVRALVQFPHVNAAVEGEALVLKRDVNLGCAVALGTTGLIVPVIRQADNLNLAGLATSLNDIAERARTKKLKPDETQGGTFTVTNVGTFGSIIGCPIINQPQLGILAIGAIKKRPMVINDMIAIRDMVYLTLSYDHRVIDGSLGGQFVQYIVKYLENFDVSRDVY